MCFKGNCDVTNEAEHSSTAQRGVGEGGTAEEGVMGGGWVEWVLDVEAEG